MSLSDTTSLSFSRFKDAAASIRRTTTEFNYQLVIQRAYEEGEEQLSENDDLDVDGVTFIAAMLIPTREQRWASFLYISAAASQMGL